MKRILYVPTITAAAIFEHEIKGQLSDGHWENDPRSTYEEWCDTEVVVSDSRLGRNFHARRDTYKLDNRDLLSVVEDRMVIKARIALEYGMDAVPLLDNLFTLHNSCIEANTSKPFVLEWQGFPSYWSASQYLPQKRRVREFAGSDDVNTIRDVLVHGRMSKLPLYGYKDLRNDLGVLMRAMRQRSVEPPTLTMASVNPATLVNME
jgi:hypothetical protein